MIGILSDDMFLYFVYNVDVTFDIASLTTIVRLYKGSFDSNELLGTKIKRVSLPYDSITSSFSLFLEVLISEYVTKKTSEKSTSNQRVGTIFINVL